MRRGANAMKWRWLVFDYVDPELPISWKDRLRLGWGKSRVKRLPARLTRGIWSVAIAVPLVLAAYGILFKLIQPWIMDWPSGWLITLTFGLPIPLLAWAVAAFLWGVTGRRANLYRIRDAGHNICLECGYWLDKLPASVQACPECGADRAAMARTMEEFTNEVKTS